MGVGFVSLPLEKASPVEFASFLAGLAFSYLRAYTHGCCPERGSGRTRNPEEDLWLL